MRTVIAMICAAAAALFVMLTISQNVADNVVASSRFETPDQAANMHMAVYMGVNLLALSLGWIAGWFAGWPFRRKPPV